ncbi:HNH endonuclease [Streptomyces buecherae]|uniref:HNH endonuclease n=1 Tax=Streptomyces buecherae TaxID=2763006 RepID=UPI00379FA12D
MTLPRAAQICYRAGCTQIVVRAGQCEDHTPAPWSRTSARNDLRHAAARRVWERRVRPQALRRDGYACVRCGSQEALTVDHITPVSRGGTWDVTNAQTLCAGCHRDKTAEDRAR